MIGEIFINNSQEIDAITASGSVYRLVSSNGARNRLELEVVKSSMKIVASERRGEIDMQGNNFTVDRIRFDGTVMWIEYFPYPNNWARYAEDMEQPKQWFHTSPLRNANEVKDFLRSLKR